MLNRISYYIKSLFKQPFKVGMVSFYYPIEKNMNNGVALHSLYLSREMAKQGCEVHIFTRHIKKILRTEYFGSGKIVIHGIEANIGSKIKDPVVQKRINYFMFDNRIIEEISEENKNIPLRVIHSHGWLTAGVFISKSLNNIPWVHTFHALEKNRLKFMALEEKKYFQIAKWMESTINSADAIISVSNKLKEESIQEYNTKPERNFVIPNGVDRNIFHDKPKISNIKQILCVGRFSLEKGIDFIPYITQKILDGDEESKFVLVASDSGIPSSLIETKKQIEVLIKTYGNRFEWIKEPISAEKLSTLYNESIIYLQPSRYESFGMTILEAMSCGCAVIVSNKGGIPEVVGNDGIVLPLNINLFAMKTIQLLKNYKLRERYSRRAIERSKNFEWEKISKKTLEIYKAIAKKTQKEKIESGEYNKQAIENLEKISGINQ